MHDSVISGHLGYKKTTAKVRRKFYWFEMRQDIKIRVFKCQICQMNKPPKAPLGDMSGCPIR